eukprot:5098243-Amphidinium_carterae.1
MPTLRVLPKTNAPAEEERAAAADQVVVQVNEAMPEDNTLRMFQDKKSRTFNSMIRSESGIST